MGQKINPIGLRLGVVRDWTSKWYSGTKGYADNLASDIRLRRHIKQRLAHAAVSSVVIQRPMQEVHVTLHSARPGIVIGKKGEDIERIRQELTKIAGVRVEVNVEEIRKPELDALLVAENICQQLEKRIMFRRAMKRAVTNAMRLGAQGIKIMCAGRLNGAEIARTEWYREGRVPLHTLRADIDYGMAEAHTTYGVVGVKVWIFKGEIFNQAEAATAETESARKTSG